MSSSPREPGTIPTAHAAFPLRMAKLSLWKRNWDDRGSPVATEMRWPRFWKKIDYKLAVLVYRCLHGLAPSYLADEFTRVSEIKSRRNLRSVSTANLVVPRFQRKTLGGRAFPVAAAQTWNSLSSHVTSSSSLTSFRRNLKTELFPRSYV